MLGDMVTRIQIDTSEDDVLAIVSQILHFVQDDTVDGHD
jgi:hypothetical protein